MKLLSYREFTEWLQLSNFSVSKNRELVAPAQSKKPRVLFAELPRVARDLSYVAAAITNWIPLNQERMLWLQNWETIPAFQWRFFEAIRGAPKSLHLIEAPGHLFSADEIWIKDQLGLSDTGVSLDTALISGMLSLVAYFGWDGYLVAKNSADYVQVTDGHVYFSSAEQQRIEGARIILQCFSLDARFARLPASE